MTATSVPLRPVRRWIHRRQVSHRERGATLGNVYFAVLFAAVVGGMVHQQLAAVFWPGHPNLGAAPALALALVAAALLVLALRRFGPVTLSRPASSFLLTAPVSRRRLLLPSLWLAAIGAAIPAALATVALLGHAAPRDLPAASLAVTVAGAGMVGMGLLLLAAAGQRGPRWAAVTDRLASLAVAAGLAALVALTAGWDPPVPSAWPPVPSLVTAVGAVTAVVAGAFLLTVRSLARTPNDRILESAKTAGTLFDAAFGMEPSFVTDMIERRYWAHRRLTSARPPAWLPVLTGQDLMLALRRRSRLLWLAGTTTLPLLLRSAPSWVTALAVLLGAMIAGTTSTGNIRTDSGNPVLSRMLGITSRQALIQRAAVPAVLATLWATTALVLLQIAGDLPPGQWWILGFPVGLAGATAAVRKARVGFVRNDMLPLDTPMGTMSTGPLANAIAGPDALVLGVPLVFALGAGSALSPDLVLIQAALALIGARGYLVWTTDTDRVELTTR
ncbi:DUF6297 family protein [Actinoplanes sp. NPDC051851]|uniref:DUF6297 family protein n=1 Tax=Actinoplanes sp. NPDC051851 TaxID=3154753 RepID=UPI0034164063